MRIFRDLPSLLDESDICKVAVNQERHRDTDFVKISTKERENSKAELNDLLCQKSYQNLVSRLKEKNLFQKEIKVTFYRNREKISWHSLQLKIFLFIL